MIGNDSSRHLDPPLLGPKRGWVSWPNQLSPSVLLLNWGLLVQRVSLYPSLSVKCVRCRAEVAHKLGYNLGRNGVTIGSSNKEMFTNILGLVTIWHRIYWGKIKLHIIREAFKLRLSLMMTFYNENPIQTTAKTSWSSSYLEFTILLYKYGLPYLYTYHKSFGQTFFWKKYGWRIPYLSTVWTYVRKGYIFSFIDGFPKKKS